MLVNREFMSIAREIAEQDGVEAVRKLIHDVIMYGDEETDSYRVIHEDRIDEIQREELANDEYLLGCFNPHFIANVTGIDYDAIKAMQEAEAFEAIGKLILSRDEWLGELQRDYVRADGYGHHFAHCDHQERMVGPYYVFRTN